MVDRAKQPSVSRRQLVVGGAATLAVQALGLGGSGCGRQGPYDLCVIGSGFAGIPLALRTVKQGMTTAVIEAGGELAPSFEFSTSGEVDYPIAGARQIGNGGTSARWGGVVSRMWPDNFHVLSEFGSLVNWPIDYDDLARYYCQSEELLSVMGGPARDPIEPPRECAYPQEIQEPPVPASLRVGNHELRFFNRLLTR